jgi:hypothetical protein
MKGVIQDTHNSARVSAIPTNLLSPLSISDLRMRPPRRLARPERPGLMGVRN